MTAHISRLAGAILLECDGQFFLIGNTKIPCHWQTEGFEPPAEIDAVKQPVFPLTSRSKATRTFPVLVAQVTGLTGEALAQVLADRFLIRRNGSVSERLWRIITRESDDTTSSAEFPIPIDWLVSMPSDIWEIVRETALKCL